MLIWELFWTFVEIDSSSLKHVWNEEHYEAADKLQSKEHDSELVDLRIVDQGGGAEYNNHSH